jgi:hypothetical protein
LWSISLVEAAKTTPGWIVAAGDLEAPLMATASEFTAYAPRREDLTDALRSCRPR